MSSFAPDRLFQKLVLEQALRSMRAAKQTRRDGELSNGERRDHASPRDCRRYLKNVRVPSATQPGPSGRRCGPRGDRHRGCELIVSALKGCMPTAHMVGCGSPFPERGRSMPIIHLAGMQIDTEKVERIEPANTPKHTNIMLKGGTGGSVTVPLEHEEVRALLAEADAVQRL